MLESVQISCLQLNSNCNFMVYNTNQFDYFLFGIFYNVDNSDTYVVSRSYKPVGAFVIGLGQISSFFS